MGTFKAVVSPKSGQSATAVITDELKSDLEAMFKHLTENPGKEIVWTSDIAPLADLAENASKAEKEAHVVAVAANEKARAADALNLMKSATAWGRTREEAVKVRQLPSKHLPAGEVRIQMSRDLPQTAENGGTKE